MSLVSLFSLVAPLDKTPGQVLNQISIKCHMLIQLSLLRQRYCTTGISLYHWHVWYWDLSTPLTFPKCPFPVWILVSSSLEPGIIIIIIINDWFITLGWNKRLSNKRKRMFSELNETKQKNLELIISASKISQF